MANMDSGQQPSRQLCTFTIDEMLFGVDVMNVQEVIRYQDVTRVPLAASSVRGLINLRGQIVTAIEMRDRLGLRARPADVLPMNVVSIVPNGGIVSFLVDEIGDVLEVDDQSYEPAPETMPSSIRRFVQGVFKLEGRLLLLLDAANVAALSSGSENRDDGR